jgi:hypothetical protein
MYRRAADLCARADHAAPAPGWLTTDAPAVRVGGGGGGRPRSACRRRPGSRLRRLCGAERCLTQRRELECRSHGTAHQLAERALVRSAGRQLGEHVFGNLGARSDGSARRVRLGARRFRSGARKIRAQTATRLARPRTASRLPPCSRRVGDGAWIVVDAAPAARATRERVGVDARARRRSARGRRGVRAARARAGAWEHGAICSHPCGYAG